MRQLIERLEVLILERRGRLTEGGILFATAGSLADIKKSIVQFYAGSKVVLEPLSKTEWSVSTGRGLQAKVHVVKKGKRFKFEMK